MMGTKKLPGLLALEVQVFLPTFYWWFRKLIFLLSEGVSFVKIVCPGFSGRGLSTMAHLRAKSCQILVCHYRFLQHRQDIGFCFGFAIVAFYSIGGTLVLVFAIIAFNSIGRIWFFRFLNRIFNS